jgi:hypothetical protein
LAQLYQDEERASSANSRKSEGFVIRAARPFIDADRWHRANEERPANLEGAGRTAKSDRLITLLLWVFYSAQILLFGAEFTRIYADSYGSHVQADEYAVRIRKTEVELPQGQ